MDSIKILVGGDVVPTKTNMIIFERGEMNQIISSELFDTLNQVDYRIFNLETPICDKESPIEKEGPCFRTSIASIKGIKALQPTLFTLANNHILDQGVSGLRSTLSVLEENNIFFTGVGENIKEANRAYYIEKNGIIVGIYGCVEHEYSCATSHLPGANPFDPLETPDKIREIKTKCDYLIVLYHGGKEYYEYPSPELQKRCHKVAECGADIIICQHSHCIGSYEEYGNAKILYGQGNFILDKYIKAYESFFQSGLLVYIDIKKSGVNWDFIPIKREKNGVRLANNIEKKQILEGLFNRSQQIAEEDFIYTNYREYTKRVANRFIVRFSKLGYIISAIDNRFLGGKLLNRNLRNKLGKHQRLAIQNCLQCETHNELIRTYLDNHINNRKK